MTIIFTQITWNRSLCNCGHHVPLVLSFVYPKQPILVLTQEWFKELSFSRLDRLHIYPLYGTFTSPSIDTAAYKGPTDNSVSCERCRECEVNELAQNGKVRYLSESILCLIRKLSWTLRPVRQANCNNCLDDTAEWPLVWRSRSRGNGSNSL